MEYSRDLLFLKGTKKNLVISGQCSNFILLKTVFSRGIKWEHWPEMG